MSRKEHPVRIVLVHSFYASRRPSGENNVVRAEVAALRDAGHDVRLLAVHTDELEQRVGYPVRAALRVATGRGRDPLRALARHEPELVHVHNLFPNFGRRWVEELDVPLVHTVHNYRPLCANGLLLRDGKICTLCPEGDRWAGVRYACYRDSRAATLPIAWANRQGPLGDPLLRRADRLVVLSERQRSMFEESGVPRDHMVIWPNFLPAGLTPDTPHPLDQRRGWLFVGRLSPEKGVVELVQRWPAGIPLRIIGDGPLRADVQRYAGRSVDLVDAIDRDRILAEMRTSVGLVVPSRTFESSATPLVYVEAMASGLPVLAFRPGAVAATVERWGTGTTVSWDDELADILPAAERRHRDLVARCRSAFADTHSEDVHLRRVMRTYAEAVSARARPHGSEAGG